MSVETILERLIFLAMILSATLPGWRVIGNLTGRVQKKSCRTRRLFRGLRAEHPRYLLSGPWSCRNSLEGIHFGQ